MGEVARELDRALTTTRDYLVEYIAHEGLTDARQWVAEADNERIEVVADFAGTERLKHIHEALHGRLDYETIRIVLACRQNREPH